MTRRNSKKDSGKTSSKEKDDLREEIRALSEEYKTNPDHILELVQFSSNFYTYSLNNTMLIHSQNPGATFVQSYKAWKDMGYPVRRQGKSMTISVPVKTTYLKIDDEYVKLSKATKEQVEDYKAGKLEAIQKLRFCRGLTFDISQTTFPPEKYPQLYSMGYPSETHEQVTKGLAEFSVTHLNVPVYFQDLNSISLRGFYRLQYREIVINEKLNSTGRLSTLSHELGHALMDHQPGKNKSASQIEWEADAMSIMIQSSLGLEISDTRKQHLKDHYTSMVTSLENFSESTLDTVFGSVYGTYKEYRPLMDECIEKYISKEQLQTLDQQRSLKTGAEKLSGKYMERAFFPLEERSM